MVYEYGTKPDIGTLETVSDSYEYKRGEYGGVQNFKWSVTWTTSVALLPSEKTFANILITKLKQKGVSQVLYMRVRRYVYHAPFGGTSYVSWILEECYFKGSPFTGADWILIIGAITTAGILIGLIVTGTFLVVKIEEAAEELGPVVTIGVGAGLLILVFMVILLILGVGFEAKGKRGAVKAGRK